MKYNEVYLEPVLEMHLYFSPDSEVYLKKTFKIYVFIVKIRSILEVDFLNFLHSNLEV